MNNSGIYFYLLKRFFKYYRLPLSVIDKSGQTIFCFPQNAGQHILPQTLMQEELAHYHEANLDYYTPYLVVAPYNSFCAIIPLPTNDFLFVGPSFSQPFTASKLSNIAYQTLSKSDLTKIHEISTKLPLVDEAYLTDALSLLVLQIHYKEITPQEILSANRLSHNSRTVFESSKVIESEYNELLLFEAQVQAFVQEGNLPSLTNLWEEFSVPIKEDFLEYMYYEHHLMIPLLSSARQAALSAGAPKENVVSIFHTTISQISTRGSLSVNLRAVERATYDLCNLVKKNKSVPFRTDLCIKCERYIDEHLTEKITASDIANYCGVDRSLVFDIFRKNYNLSLTEYIQNEKLRRATVMLLHSNASISDIAFSLGFCSSSYFTKVFCTHYGCNPTKYRNSKMPKSLD